MSTTLKELAVLYAKKQEHMVDAVTEEAPILAITPFFQASHDFSNVYEELDSVTGAAFVDLDEALPTLDAQGKLGQIDLSVFGGQMEVGEDKARRYGGAGNYFAQKEGPILRKSGQTAEDKIIYDNFRKHAIDSAQKINAGGTGGSHYSIVAVKFVEGETSGLFSPLLRSNGQLFDTTPLNGGSLYKTAAGINGYGVRLKAYWGIMSANSRNVGVLANIDASNKPTAVMMDDLIDLVRGNPANTFLFMHNKVKNFVSELKTAKVQYTPADTDPRPKFDDWDGVSMVTSYNMKKATEDEVSFS